MQSALQDKEELALIIDELEYRKKVNPLDFFENMPQQGKFGEDKAKTRGVLGGNTELAYGTMVKMADGKSKPIEDIIIGDYILAWNGEESLPTQVIDIPYDDYSECYKVTTASGLEVEGSKDHCFPIQHESNDVKRIMYEVPLELAIYVRIYLETGIRLNELINVERKNIDIQNNTLSGIGKRRKPFQVSISQKSMGYLYELGWLEKEFPFKQDNVKDTSKWVHYRFKKYSKTLGYPNTSIHQIRHCVAQYLRKEKKVPLEIIKEVLRHSSIVTTQRYASASKEEAEQIMKELLE